MKAMHPALRALVVAACLSLTGIASAASFSTDQSDLWYIQAESGWGMQLVQRGSTIFATLFVYGPNGTPTWYVANMLPTGAAFQWSGDLYATTGPWFGTVPFNPANVTVAKVGTMTWTGQTVTTGNVSYTVNGVPVSKNVVRQTLVFENYSGHFGGAIHEVNTGCANPNFNGTFENLGILDIAQNGSSVSIVTQPLNAAVCTYSGMLTQYGQMGDVAGTYACTNGEAGTFEAFELQVTEFSVTGHFVSSAMSGPAVGCHGSGYFGGLRATTI